MYSYQYCVRLVMVQIQSPEFCTVSTLSTLLLIQIRPQMHYASSSAKPLPSRPLVHSAPGGGPCGGERAIPFYSRVSRQRACRVGEQGSVCWLWGRVQYVSSCFLFLLAHWSRGCIKECPATPGEICNAIGWECILPGDNVFRFLEKD